MSSRVRVGIAGTGSYLPERVVTNEDIARLVDTSDEWIRQRTGIGERRHVEPGQNTSDLSFEAAKRALEQAGLTATDLDMIIVGTVTPDCPMPTVSCRIQEMLGATRAASMDVNAACTGFLTALHTAEAFVASGRCKNVLAIGAESLSRFVDFTDRGSCILFGDGAGAAIVSTFDDCQQGEILETRLGSDGSGYDFIHMPMGGAEFPPHSPDYRIEDHFIKLKGRDVYRFAVTKMTEMIEAVTADIDRDDVALLVPHQVNQRIIDAALARMGWASDRCFVNIEKYGNTSAASVPIALDEAHREGRLTKGKYIVLVAFGAGLTWGATLLRW